MYDKVVDAWYKHLVGVKSSASPEVSDMQEAIATEVTIAVPWSPAERRSVCVCVCQCVPVCSTPCL